jgi:hypothetical protein
MNQFELIVQDSLTKVQAVHDKVRAETLDHLSNQLDQLEKELTGFIESHCTDTSKRDCTKATSLDFHSLSL